MAPIIGHCTISKPEAAIPAPTTPPTMACVVETGAPRYVARWIHSAADSMAAVMTSTNSTTRIDSSGRKIRFDTVSTTSPPARMAPAASQIAAMTSALVMVSARLPTAGPMLLATSLAPTFSAM